MYPFQTRKHRARVFTRCRTRCCEEGTHRSFVPRPQHTQAGFEVASGPCREVLGVGEQQPLAEISMSCSRQRKVGAAARQEFRVECLGRDRRPDQKRGQALHPMDV